MPDLAGVGTHEWAACSASTARRRALAGIAALRLTVRRPPSSALTRWAEELHDPGGDLPLLGTGRRAGWYEALLWNAARHSSDPSLVAGLLGAPGDLPVDALGRALVAADAVTAEASIAHGDGAASADVRTLGCAVAVCLVGVLGPDRSAGVLDVAASLMLLSAPDTTLGTERTALLRAGHPAAAGRLACEVVAAGLTGLAGAVPTTLLATTGPPPRAACTAAHVVGALS